MIERSVHGVGAALCQITLTTCLATVLTTCRRLFYSAPQFTQSVLQLHCLTIRDDWELIFAFPFPAIRAKSISIPSHCHPQVCPIPIPMGFQLGYSHSYPIPKQKNSSIPLCTFINYIYLHNQLLIGWQQTIFIFLFLWQRNHSLFGPMGLQSTMSMDDSELNALSWSLDEPRQLLTHSASYGGFVYAFTDRFRNSIRFVYQ